MATNPSPNILLSDYLNKGGNELTVSKNGLGPPTDIEEEAHAAVLEDDAADDIFLSLHEGLKEEVTAIDGAAIGTDAAVGARGWPT